MKLLLIDNYDSFTYNIFHYLEAHPKVHTLDVWMNDEIDMQRVEGYDAIVLSPGPGLPQKAGQMMELIDLFWGKKPILGICLGMQALAISKGHELYNLPEILHGREDLLTDIHPDSILLKNVANLKVGRYHSWAIKTKEDSPFTITSRSSDQVIMTFESLQYKAFGIQFHPESILSPEGRKMLYQFIEFI